MTDNTRALLEQALDALTYQGYMGPTRRQRRAAAEEAIRSELAKPVEPAAPVAEIYPGHLRPADNGGHWCREVLLYSGNNPGDQGGRTPRVKLYLHPPTIAWHDAPETIALKAERDRYRQALEAMTKKEPCDCGCPSGESVVILKPTHYYAIASEALKGDAAIAKAEGRME